MRIELCGGIGAGKTTFTMLMQRVGIVPAVENFGKNPFWEAFYSDPGKHVFETELTFMLQHYHQIKTFEETHKSYACDYSTAQDLAYAKIGLKGAQLSVFSSLYREIISEVGYPDLLVYLSCSVQVMLDRIQRRGRTVEMNISGEFLGSLITAMEAELMIVKNKTKVVVIDSVREDFAFDEASKVRVVELINQQIQS